jgi:hypothetical protein
MIHKRLQDTTRIGKAALLPALALALGCSGSDDILCEDLAAEPAFIELGTGVTEYEPLAAGDTLEVHEGPQGGWHVFGSFKAYGLHPGTQPGADGNPLTEFELRLDDGTIIANKPREAPLDRSGEFATRIGEVVILSIEHEESTAMEGRAAAFSLAVTDQCGRRADADVDIRMAFFFLEQ